MQISGNTITITDEEALPLQNVPMIPFVADSADGKVELAERIREKIDKYDADDLNEVFALGFHMHGTPKYEFLDVVVDAAIDGWEWADGSGPFILLFDQDVAMNVGRIAAERVDAPVVSIDSIDLAQFGYIDVGDSLKATNAVPVTVKSLVFEG
jgi:ethanolamine utilization protein EutA